jgi:hypothetical protein
MALAKKHLGVRHTSRGTSATVAEEEYLQTIFRCTRRGCR